MANMDEGLKAAIKAAGGFRPLARLLGISSSALSKWKRVPAHRILQVEAVTGVEREQLWPDLYREQLELPLEIAPASNTSSDKSAA
jgi:DNA-binding transcriptional regulator YdaS (Cro superfamily)